jgi:hypothetical protein
VAKKKTLQGAAQAIEKSYRQLDFGFLETTDMCRSLNSKKKAE